MNYDLPEPNEKLINKYLLKFSIDKRYFTADKAIEKLIKIFPNNVCIKEIQLKISVINDLYSTNIFSTFKIAEHIHSLNIDTSLLQSDYSIVHKIAVGHSIKSKKTTNDYNFYSFFSWLSKYFCLESLLLLQSLIFELTFLITVFQFSVMSL